MSDSKNNPFSSAILDFCEQSAPKAKQAVDDWKQFCTACLDGGTKVQRTAMKSAGLKTNDDSQLETIWRNLAENMLNAQAEFSKAYIDVSLKALGSILKKA